MNDIKYNSRTFQVSAFVDAGNSTKIKKQITHISAHGAATQFALDRAECIYEVRMEQPETIDGQLYKVWSASWSGSGQRIWVREALN
jgi:hypothetical protein